jgi:serine/threonine-protein kinase
MVFKAYDEKLDCPVALKVLKPELAASAGDRVRFEGEARKAAAVRHDHVVTVHRVGSTPGFALPYFVMEYLEGESLRDRLQAQGPLAPKESAEIARQVALGLAAAHAHGLVHRDIKPSNIMLEKPSGRAKITDFGLAKSLGVDGGQTQSGAIVGTPSYMAPEQAAGKTREVGPAADIYALGAVLYEMLTGRPPFRGAALVETLQRVLSEEPLPPRRLQPGAPRDLETICLKCLHKEPRQRYASAVALAEDLRRLLAGEPIRARPVGGAERLWRWCRRQPVVAGLAAALGLAVAGGLGAWLWLAQAQAQRRAETARAVEQALAEATWLRGQARAGPAEDLGAWSKALAAAKRAEALLEPGEGDGDGEMRRRVRALLAELAAEEQDRRMAERLEDIRLGQADVRDGHFDVARADQDYAAAFRAYGIDVDALAPAEAAVRIRRRAIKDQLAAALDHWASVRGDAGGRQRLIEVARRVDPDPWRNRFREALAGKDVRALKVLAESDEVTALPRPSLYLLGKALAATGDLPGAVGLLRKAQQRHPGDFWINHNLAFYLSRLEPPQWDEALRFYTAAVALRSQSAGAHVNLGGALAKKGEMDRAVASFREAIRLRADYAQAHFNLGFVLAKKGELDRAIPSFREAIRLDPGDAQAHCELGRALGKKGELDGAVAAYRQALRLEPEYPEAHNNLGGALQAQGKLPEAVAACRQAIRLKPTLAEAHYNLGNALWDLGQPDRAVSAYRQAIRLKPTLAEAHHNLGLALAKKGELDGAVAAYRQAIRLDRNIFAAHLNLGALLCDQEGDYEAAAAAFREAIRLEPTRAEAHYNLGNALGNLGQLDGAIAAYRQAIRLEGDYALAYCNLGRVLQRRGQFAEALAALRRGHDLGSRDPLWTYPSAQRVRQCERRLGLDGKLPALLRGEVEPADAAERAEFAELCALKGLHQVAARLYQEALDPRARLAGGVQVRHRYRAACAAALAGCGQGEGAAEVDGRQRPRWRQQALEWLRDDLRLWSGHLDSDTPQARDRVRRKLRQWERDPALAGLRDPGGLAGLPAAEREACRRLWAEVDALLERARGGR